MIKTKTLLHSFAFIAVLLCLLGEANAAKAQEFERFGQLKLDPANPDSLKALVKLLKGAQQSGLCNYADSSRWIAPFLTRRTSPDGKFTAEITDNGLLIKKANSDVVVKSIKAQKSERNPFTGARINDFSWSPDSKELIYGGQNGLHLYDLASGTIKNSGDPDLLVSRLTWSSGGKYIAMIRSSDHFKTHLKNLVILEFPALNEVFNYSISGANSVAWSCDGNYLAFNSGQGITSILDTRNKFAKKSICRARSGSLCWSPNGKYLAIADYFSNLKIYRVDDCKPIQTLDQTGVENFAWSCDGKNILIEKREPVPLIAEIPLKLNANETDLLIETVPEPKPGDGDFMPKDINECYQHFDKLFPLSIRADIKEMPVPSDVIKYHHGLGTFLRNTLGLWSGSVFKDYLEGHTNVQHPDDISNYLLRGYWYHLRGESHDVFADMAKAGTNDCVKLEAPKDGPQLDQRRVVYSGLSRMKEAGINIDDYAERFNKIESMVEKKVDESEIAQSLEKVRKSYSRNLGRLGSLCDQLYDDGPLNKLCREMENALRSRWKKNKAFQENVWFFCYVQPDGTISNIEADNPKKYGAATCSKGKKQLLSLELKSPFPLQCPIPLVVTLNNDPNEIQVYVRHLNFSPYWYVFDSKVRKYWSESKLGQDGQVEVHMRVYRDGKIKNLVIVKGSGDADFDKKVMEVMSNAPSFGHFPDGSHEYSEMDQTWGFRYRF